MSDGDWDDVAEELVESHADGLEIEAREGGREYVLIPWETLEAIDVDFAHDFVASTDREQASMKRPIRNAVIDSDAFDLESPSIHVTEIPDDHAYYPIEVSREDPDGYVAVRGQLKKVSQPTRAVTEAAFDCASCGSITRVPQSGYGLFEPAQCQACDGNALTFNKRMSEFDDYCKIRIETPPDESGQLQNDHIDGIVEGPMVWYGHDEYGLVGRTGASAEVYGNVEYVQRNGRGENDRCFDMRLDVDSIDLDSEDDDLEIEEYRDEFEELAERDDAVDIFAESLVPQLYATPEWERGLEALVAYLFGAPRIHIPDGPTYRGDIHILIISDYGMGKSMVNRAVSMYSPKCIKESVTGMASDVGLLAAAVEDDFDEGGWTLRPGILVRANGGHVILDEIDKTDADLEKMNDALEGEQMVDVNKAGQSATFKSRVGLLATGNPAEGRFEKYEPIAEQLNIDESLLSRFDGIITMKDEANVEVDASIAETIGKSYVEAQEYEFGERDEFDTLERVVDVDVGKHWIAYARENVRPLLRREHYEEIRDWYAEEVRQLNNNINSASQGEEVVDMPVPVSSRVVENTIRFSVAFARVHLRDVVAQVDVDRAKELAKTLVSQNFDGETFSPQEAQRKRQSQRKRVENVKAFIDQNDECDIDQIATALGMDKMDVEHEVEKLKRKGEVYEPDRDGRYRST